MKILLIAYDFKISPSVLKMFLFSKGATFTAFDPDLLLLFFESLDAILGFCIAIGLLHNDAVKPFICFFDFSFVPQIIKCFLFKESVVIDDIRTSQYQIIQSGVSRHGSFTIALSKNPIQPRQCNPITSFY